MTEQTRLLVSLPASFFLLLLLVSFSLYIDARISPCMRNSSVDYRKYQLYFLSSVACVDFDLPVLKWPYIPGSPSVSSNSFFTFRHPHEPFSSTSSKTTQITLLILFSPKCMCVVLCTLQRLFFTLFLMLIIPH